MIYEPGKQRTNSPISDPQPFVAEMPQVQAPEIDPVTTEKANFRNDKKYDKVLKAWDERMEGLKQQVATKPENMSYEEFGMKTEIANRVSQELENFKADLELAYGLQKQSRP